MKRRLSRQGRVANRASSFNKASRSTTNRITSLYSTSKLNSSGDTQTLKIRLTSCMVSTQVRASALAKSRTSATRMHQALKGTLLRARTSSQ